VPYNVPKILFLLNSVIEFGLGLILKFGFHSYQVEIAMFMKNPVCLSKFGRGLGIERDKE
jgi:hypothetical protein